MSDRRGSGPRRAGPSTPDVGVGAEPSPLVGGLRGLGKVAAAVAVLTAGAVVVAAAVAALS